MQQVLIVSADREDMEIHTERLILRCLTIEASVTTPRNEIQEQAFKTVSEHIEELSLNCQEDPHTHFDKLCGCLNASLPDPLSSNIDSRFQSKLLGCTADDQKLFRKKLETLHGTVSAKMDGYPRDGSPASDGSNRSINSDHFSDKNGSE